MSDDFVRRTGEQRLISMIPLEIVEEITVEKTKRCSMMYSFCPRKLILHELLKKHKKVFPALARMRMDFGTAIHSWLQNQYYGPIGILKTGEYGAWVCTSCNKEVKGFMPKFPCVGCHGEGAYKINVGWNQYWEYKEPELYGLFGNTERPDGHCDGIVEIDGEDFLLEIKTVGTHSLRYMEFAYDSHVFQANLYMKALGLKKAIIQYIDRGLSSLPGMDLPIKEFVIEFSEIYYQQALNRIKVYEACVKEKIVPRMLPECSKDSKCFLMRFCEYAQECKNIGKEECKFQDILLDDEWSTIESVL